MTYITHFLAGVVLFVASIFGMHAAVSSNNTATVASSTTTAAATTSVSAHTTNAVASAPAPMKPSLLSSITSTLGTTINNAVKVSTQAVTPPAGVTVTTATQTQTTAPASVPAVPAVPSGTAAAPSTGTNTIDQTQVRARLQVPVTGVDSYSYFYLTGHSSNAQAVNVALVPATFNATDWATVSGSASTRILPASVANGAWSTTWKGILSGNYTVLVYDGSSSALLVKGSLNVSETPVTLPSTDNPTYPLTIGIGQTLTDAIVQVTLVSISNVGGVATATFSVSDSESPSNNNGLGGFSGRTYTAASGGALPKAGIGFDDEYSSGALNLMVTDVSASEGTVTLLPKAVQESTSANGAPPTY